MAERDGGRENMTNDPNWNNVIEPTERYCILFCGAFKDTGFTHFIG